MLPSILLPLGRRRPHNLVAAVRRSNNNNLQFTVPCVSYFTTLDSLPQDVRFFLHSLTKRDCAPPTTEELAVALERSQWSPLVLQHAIAFARAHPTIRTFITPQAVTSVLDSVQEAGHAEELLWQWMYECNADGVHVVLNKYAAADKSVRSLRRMENIVFRLEMMQAEPRAALSFDTNNEKGLVVGGNFGGGDESVGSNDLAHFDVLLERMARDYKLSCKKPLLDHRHYQLLLEQYQIPGDEVKIGRIVQTLESLTRACLDGTPANSSVVDPTQGLAALPISTRLKTLVLRYWNKTLGQGAVEKVTTLFKSVQDIEKDTAMCNEMLDAFSNCGKIHNAQCLLDEMIQSPNCQPDEETSKLLVKAFGSSTYLDVLKHVHAVVSSTESVDGASYNVLLKTLISQGFFDVALSTFRKVILAFKDTPAYEFENAYHGFLMTLKQCDDPAALETAKATFDYVEMPTALACNILLVLFATHGRRDDAEKLLDRMVNIYDLKPTQETTELLRIHLSLRPAYVVSSRRSEIEEAFDLLRACFDSDEKGSVQKAEIIYHLVEKQKRTGRFSSELIKIYHKHGQLDKAQDLCLQLVADYKNDGLPAALPNIFTLYDVLSAWSNSKRQDASEKTNALFVEIDKSTAYHVSIVLALHGKRGILDDAVSLLAKLKAEHDSGRKPLYRPEAQVYTSLLRALRTDKRDAFEISQSAFTLTSQEMISRHYEMILLYARHGRFADALRLLSTLQSDYFETGKTDCKPPTFVIDRLLGALYHAKGATYFFVARLLFDSVNTPSPLTFNNYLRMCAEHGERAEARRVLSLMSRCHQWSPHEDVARELKEKLGIHDAPRFRQGDDCSLKATKTTHAVGKLATSSTV
jgi:hypothetical protein